MVASRRQAIGGWRRVPRGPILGQAIRVQPEIAPMWVLRSLVRARRHFRPVAIPPEPPADDTVGDLVVSVVRNDLERLIAALAASGSPGLPRPDSPARLATALTAVIGRVAGAGRPTVTRSPAGLYTPEYWHIRVEGADRRTRVALGRLTAGERIG